MKSVKLIGMALVMMLSACATTEGHRRAVASWQGKDVDSLLIAWGRPTSVTELSDGVTMLDYHSSRTSSSSQAIPGHKGSTYTANYAFEYECRTTFFVKDKKVINWRFEGNDCTSR